MLIVWCIYFNLSELRDLFYLLVSTLFCSFSKLWKGRFWEGSWTLQESYGNKRSRDFVNRWKSNFSTLIKWRHIQLKKCIITKRFAGTWTKVIQTYSKKRQSLLIFSRRQKITKTNPFFQGLCTVWGLMPVFMNSALTLQTVWYKVSFFHCAWVHTLVTSSRCS